MLAVVLDQPGDRAGGPVAAGGDQVAQLQHQGLHVDVGEAGHPALRRGRSRSTRSARSALVRAMGEAGRRRWATGPMPMTARHPVADPVEEVVGDRDGALLAVLAVARDRDQAVGDVADQRGRRTAGGPRSGAWRTRR